MNTLDCLKRLCQTGGPSGYETHVAAVAAELLAPWMDEVWTDRLGNVIGVRRCGKPNAKRLLLDAHLDQIGLMVTGVEDGYLRFTSIGGVDPRMLPGREVTILTQPSQFGIISCPPTHGVSQEERGRAPALTEYYVDTGLSQEAAEEKIPVGTPMVFRECFLELEGGRICSGAMDDRACFVALLRTAQLLSGQQLDVDLYIMGSTREEAEQMVQVGDVAVYRTPVFQAGNMLTGPYLDNRISCLVLLSAMERLKESPNDLYFVFSSQEEVGLRGAKTAAWSIDPDYGIAVDVTSEDGQPGAKHTASSLAGKGAAVKVMDRSVICHPQMVKLLMELAQSQDIPAQRDVIQAGGTDAGVIHQTRGGVYTGGISIPCRYVHSPCEMVCVHDVQACVDLVTALAETKLEKEC